MCILQCKEHVLYKFCLFDKQKIEDKSPFNLNKGTFLISWAYSNVITFQDQNRFQMCELQGVHGSFF